MRLHRGQVSSEMLFSIVILLFLFVIVLLFIEQIKQQSNTTQGNISEQEICSKFTSIITYMSSNPPYTETLVELPQDINVINGNIFVGDIFCPFWGKAANTQLYAGVVKAFDVNGTVVFTNDLNYSPFLPSVGPPGSDAGASETVILLIDDKGQTWSNEVKTDDASYAVSTDNADVDPDWVEFRFTNSGLTAGNHITEVRVLTKHFESSQFGLDSNKTRFQCCVDATCTDFGPYTPSFTELFYQSPDLSSCITDWNLANNARVRMTYEPNGSGDTISIDYGRIDINFNQVGSVINLWEVQADLPQPVDFQTDVNSTANTFGPGAGNDGWDWNKLSFGGTLDSSVQFNTDPNDDGSIADSNVGVADRILIKLGGGLPGSTIDPDDSLATGPLTSGAYGVQFDINASHWSSIQGGAQLLFSFTYFVDADAGWGNTLDAGEEGWVKARFGRVGNMTYLGSNLDNGDNDADASNEIWWEDTPVDASGFFNENVASLVTGPGTYYIEIGAGLSDWDGVREGMTAAFDNVNLVVV